MPETSLDKNKETKKSRIEFPKIYNVWQQYDEFVRSLHLKKTHSVTTRGQLFNKFLKKLFIVGCGAFLTTLTFYFLITPNEIYNPGLNGIWQIITRLLVGHKWITMNRYFGTYLGFSLAANLIIIFSLRYWWRAKLGMATTAIFYVLFQLLWTFIFQSLELEKSLFSSFNSSSWKEITGRQQFSLTLPFYLVIAAIAAIIHTYGYSIIFRAQATPGGFEIISAHFAAQPKAKFSLSQGLKVSGWIILFFVTLLDFLYIEDNPDIKINTCDIKISQDKGAVDLEIWKDNMEKSSVKTNPENYYGTNTTTYWLEKITGTSNLETWWKNIEDYRKQRKGVLIEELEKKIKINAENKLPTSELKSELKMLEKNYYPYNFYGYIKFISNNERLWATVCYIFISSLLMSRIFPRERIICLKIYSMNEADRLKACQILENFSPFSYNIFQEEAEKKIIYVTECYLSRWNYFLLSPKLKPTGKIYVNETD